MAQQVINDIVLKKIQGSPFTSVNNSVATEKAGSSAYRIQSQFIYSQDIPSTAPNLDSTGQDVASGTKYTGSSPNSHITKYDKVSLKPVQTGSDTFYYGDTDINSIISTNALIDAIPSNQDPGASYQITIFEKTIAGTFNETSKKYFFDTASGYITFLDDDHGFNGTTNIPYITYFRYEGFKGVGGGKWTSSSNDIYYNDGNVGIGTTNPTYKLQVDGNFYFTGGDCRIKMNNSGNTTHFSYGSYGDHYIRSNSSSGKVILQDTGGNVGIGTSSVGAKLHIKGHELRHETGNGTARWFQPNGTYTLNWAGYDKMYIRPDNDVLLDNFTGQHRTFVENILHTDASHNQGLIVCANKNTYISISDKLQKGNKAIMQNESLPLVSLSTKSKDKSCFGVISESEDPELRGDRVASVFFPTEKEQGDTRIFINSVGEGAIWVSNKNGSLESGDYITTSDIPGYGEKQDDDILHNYTVAKITMDCDFNPQLQPKEVILKEAAVDDSGNTVYNNVLDSNGEIQWVPQLDSLGNVIQEYPYNIRYLDQQGNLLTKQQYDNKLPNESVYIAAYVGCTYHCG